MPSPLSHYLQALATTRFILNIAARAHGFTLHAAYVSPAKSATAQHLSLASMVMWC
jgi:hypothetical protein